MNKPPNTPVDPDDSPMKKRVASADEPAVELTAEFASEDSAQIEYRRQALRSMLAATEARQHSANQARSKRTLAAGINIEVLKGTYQGHLGTILDADFIHSKALVWLRTDQSERWFDFADIAPAADSDI